MTVTEFALLRLRRDGHGDADLLEAILQCTEAQDQWIDENQPHMRDTDEGHSSIYIQQNGNEPCLLITAPWESPASHQEWIQSSENQEAMSQLLQPHLAEEDAVELFHMESASLNPRLLLDDVVSRTAFNVARLSVTSADKKAVEKEYQLLEQELQKASSTRQIWAGWKVEDDKDGRETLVVFWDHAAQSQEVSSFLTKFEQQSTRSFKSICSESVCKL